eukprot:TRINITY_DN40049_c0_g1_i1.p1 TRINITY_DN40049_c0_g1~~TRINITY_DN40049_c0_g1_i1.p1  ORF type:complete len:538 (-),score=47.83 TRINITY_DN40049_c0_g1_i1:102-1598(-)
MSGMQVDDQTKEQKADQTAEESEEEQRKSKERQILVVLFDNLNLVLKSVEEKEAKLYYGRVFRQTGTVRGSLSTALLLKLFNKVEFADGVIGRSLKSVLSDAPQAMDTDNGADIADDPDMPTISKYNGEAYPEIDAYCVLLTVMYLHDNQDYEHGKQILTEAVQKLRAINRRTLDVLAARIYFYYSLAFESLGILNQVRNDLLALYQQSVLRRDDIGQETLLNLLLRNYLHYNLYDQAEKLRSKAQRPEQSRSNTQFCRYLYYLGRIRAVQLEYTEAKESLQQSLRKAPSSALAFRVIVSKWLIIIRLLLGEIPERVGFTQPGMEVALKPYFELTQAVRSGDLHMYKQVLDNNKDVFEKDKTSNFVVRLRTSVIRIGLRRISLAYSHISLNDIAVKLGLSSGEEAESIVAKAIRDGGIDAVLDHVTRTMRSREVANVYITKEPQEELHARIAFCMDIHNEAVKAMRYDVITKDGAKEGKNRMTPEDIAKALAEQEDDF